MPTLKINADGSPHIHTFYRQRGGKRWYCKHPECSYSNTSRSDVLGKKSLCAVCGRNEIVLDREALRRAEPRCTECSTTATAQRKQDFMKTLRGMGID